MDAYSISGERLVGTNKPSFQHYPEEGRLKRTKSQRRAEKTEANVLRRKVKKKARKALKEELREYY